MGLFVPTRPLEDLHENFRTIHQAKKNHASRQTMQSIFDRFPNPDNNFVLDFQTTGFDARIWELYLGGIFQSLGMNLSQPHDRPDFLLSRNGSKLWVEATTANPTQGAKLEVGEDHWSEQDRIGLKLGSALYSKLQKRYWELPHVAGLPLVFAVADFHDSHPVRNTSAAMGRYLYGMHITLLNDPEERGYPRLRLRSTPVRTNEKRLKASCGKSVISSWKKRDRRRRRLLRKSETSTRNSNPGSRNTIAEMKACVAIGSNFVDHYQREWGTSENAPTSPLNS
jgi:hypothetical protein